MNTRNLLAILTAIIIASTAAADGGPDDRVSKPVPGVAEKLQEIIDLQQRLVEGHKLQVKAGQAIDDGRPEVAIAEARIELARELRRPADVLAALEQIVAVHKKRLEWAIERSDRMRPIRLVEIRVDLLKAEIRLARARADLQK